MYNVNYKNEMAFVGAEHERKDEKWKRIKM